MPIYQYQCTDCGHRKEALQKMSDPLLTDCPSCNKPSLKKQLTAAAFKLKGTGWYETDFKNSGKAPEPSKSEGSLESSQEGASSTNSSASTESTADSSSASAG